MEKKTLESLVPPLDLCKQIPQGAFENSVLVWMGDLDGDPVLFPRECGICNQYGAEIAIAPAPTLAEIILRQNISVNKRMLLANLSKL